LAVDTYQQFEDACLLSMRVSVQKAYDVVRLYEKLSTYRRPKNKRLMQLVYLARQFSDVVGPHFAAADTIGGDT
jgi:hypothetical protein